MMNILTYLLASASGFCLVSRFSCSNLKFNNQLSEIFTRLWELDVNKCKPDVDYKLDLQGV